MTKHFRDAAGNYIGGFDGAQPPAGSIEVPVAPTHAAQRWDGARWIDTPAIEAARAAELLADSDKRMARAGEELWDALKRKGVLVDGDISADARALIESRKTARAKL